MKRLGLVVFWIIIFFDVSTGFTKQCKPEDPDYGGQCVVYVRGYFGGDWDAMPGLCQYDCGAYNAWGGTWDLGFGSGQMPAKNSIMVMAQQNGQPYGHVAVVTDSKCNTDGTFTLTVNESNWIPDSECIDENVEYTFYPETSNVSREGGASKYSILGFIYGEQFLDIKANGMDCGATVDSFDDLSLKITLVAGDQKNKTTELFLVAKTPSDDIYHVSLVGWDWLTGSISPTAVVSLPDIPSTEVFYNWFDNMPDGKYTFYFAMDTTIDGGLSSGLIYDYVEVAVADCPYFSSPLSTIPADGGTVGTLTPTLEWSLASCVTLTQTTNIWMSDDYNDITGTCNNCQKYTVTDTSFTIPDGELEDGNMYWWKVGTSWGEWSDVFSFTVNDVNSITGFTTEPQVSAGIWHVVGLQDNGKVVAAGANYWGECDVSSWKNIIQISAGASHTLGLKNDGTVIIAGTGSNSGDEYDQTGVFSWKDIIQISAGRSHSAGLRSDGTVVAVGRNDNDQCEVSSWTNIIQISAGSGRTAGLRSDGTVVVATDSQSYQSWISSWEDIIQISGEGAVFGLKSDGTVIGGTHGFETNSWQDVKQTSGSSFYSFGLQHGGSVLCVGGDFYYGNTIYVEPCSVSSWSNIVQISTSAWYTIGLQDDGKVVVTGSYDDNQLDLSSWDLKISTD